MANGQTLNVKFRTDTAEFDEGVNRIKEKFTSLSSKMQETKDKIKVTNDELKQAVTEFEKLSNQKSIGLPIDEKGYKALTEQIVVLKNRLSELTVDEKLLNIELKSTNKELEEQYKALLLVDKNIPVTENVEGLGKAFGTVGDNMPKSSELTNIARAFIPLTSNIKGAGTAVNILKSAIGTGSWIGFAALALNLAITAVMSYNDSMEKANKVTTESVQQSLDKAKTSREEAEELIKLVSEYEKLGKKTNLTGDEKNKLIEIQDTLNDKYIAEANNIDVVNGKYKEQIELLKEASIENLKKAEQDARSAYYDAEDVYYNVDGTNYNASEAAESYNEYIKEMEKILDNKGSGLTADPITGIIFNEIEYRNILKKVRDYEERTEIFIEAEERWTKIKEYLTKAEKNYNQELKNTVDVTNGTIKSLSDLSSEAKNLSNAFAESNTEAGLSVDTTIDLINKGYAACLMFDDETGKVKLNTEAYKELSKAKLEVYRAELEIKRNEAENAFYNANPQLVGRISPENIPAVKEINANLAVTEKLINGIDEVTLGTYGELKNKYSTLADQYEETSKKRIEAANAEKKAIEKTYKTEIDKINEALEARKRLRDESDQYKKINEINARLKYDQLDEISRYELEREKERLEKDWADTQFQWTAADNKESLEKQYKIDTDNIDVLISNINSSLSNLNTVTKEIEKSMMPQYSANVVNEYNDLIRNPTFVFNASDFTKSQLEDLVRDVMRKELYDR